MSILYIHNRVKRLECIHLTFTIKIHSNAFIFPLQIKSITNMVVSNTKQYFDNYSQQCGRKQEL